MILVCLLLQVSANAQSKGWFYRTGAHAQASPVIADLNGDTRMEVIFTAYDGKLYILNHDGTVFNPGGAPWPQAMGFAGDSISSPAVGDVDGDGQPEIVVVGHSLTSLNATVKVFKVNGDVTSQLLNANASGKATPCLIDCCRYISGTVHPAKEIVVRDGNGIVHVLYRNGTAYSERDTSAYFDTTTTDSIHDQFGAQPITSSAAALATSSDKTYVAIGSTDGRVYRWDITSTATTQWSVSALSNLNSSDGNAYFLATPVIADLDQSSVSPAHEVVAAGTDKRVYVWSRDGSLRSGWPQVVTQAIVSSPVVANLDSDPELEIIVGCNDGGVYAWNEDGTAFAGSNPLCMTNGEVFGSPLVADVDGQTGPEIVAGSMDGFLYAWTTAGVPLDGWPKRIGSSFYSAPAIADLHHGGRQSIIAVSYSGSAYVFDLARKYVSASGWTQFLGGPERNSSYKH